MAEPMREMELLLACAAPGAPPLPPLHGIDWEVLLQAAGQHHMQMLLARRLLPESAVPARARERLAAEARAGGARAMGMLAELAALIDTLEGAGIPAAAYKGPVLGVQAYGDPALRWCSDLDVLVAPADVGAAIRRLEAAGYRSLKALTPAREAMFRRSEGEYPLRHPERSTLVELHCHLSSPRFAARFDVEGLLRTRQPVATGPFRVNALPVRPLLIALAAHGARHRWARLEWLAAFAALLAPRGHDREGLERDAREMGAGRAFRIALELAGRLPGASPPPERLDPATAALADEAWGRMLSRRPRPDPGDIAENLRFNLKLSDTGVDRLRTAWRWGTLPTAEDWGWLPLPDALFPAYRVLRPIRLLYRYGRPRTD